MNADFTNGCMQLVSGIMALSLCWAVYIDKTGRGVSVISAIAYAALALWNVYYYTVIDQVWSTAGSVVTAAANTLWVGLIVYYRRRRS